MKNLFVIFNKILMCIVFSLYFGDILGAGIGVVRTYRALLVAICWSFVSISKLAKKAGDGRGWCEGSTERQFPIFVRVERER